MTDGADRRRGGGGRRRSTDADAGTLPLGASRRGARERALELLYEAEAKDVAPSVVLDQLPVAPDDYTVDVVGGVEAHADGIDGLIRRFTRGWALERMPAIDRALLRMAVFELGHRPDVPTGVVISEAVELAKAYSTDESGRFVNGMLAAIADELRGPRPGRGGADPAGGADAAGGGADRAAGDVGPAGGDAGDPAP